MTEHYQNSFLHYLILFNVYNNLLIINSSVFNNNTVEYFVILHIAFNPILADLPAQEFIIAQNLLTHMPILYFNAYAQRISYMKDKNNKKINR